MSRRIFLVDDDEVVRNTLSHGLTEHGFVVTSFADGHSALSQWAINPPDCAVVDIGLPDMSGAELVTQMLSRMHRPVLVLSRHHDSAVVSDAIASGVSRLSGKACVCCPAGSTD